MLTFFLLEPDFHIGPILKYQTYILLEFAVFPTVFDNRIQDHPRQQKEEKGNNKRPTTPNNAILSESLCPKVKAPCPSSKSLFDIISWSVKLLMICFSRAVVSSLLIICSIIVCDINSNFQLKYMPPQ